MDKIKIVGGNRLEGTIPISGAKNAALPLMIASLLTKETLTLENMPLLADVTQLERILGNHGVDYAIAGKRPGETANSGRTVHLTAREIVDTTAPYELVSRMRASFWVLAPLLARMGEARVSLPGGCAIGTRPVDLLLMAMEKLGAKIDIENGYVVAFAKDGLRGAEIDFPKVTVGGTHTALMARLARQGNNAAAQRRARTGNRRSRRLPREDGRAHIRRRNIDDRDRGRRFAAWRASRRSSRSDRGRHLRHGGGHDRRRRVARRRADRSAASRVRRAGRGRRASVADQRRRARRPQRLGDRPGGCDDAAVSGGFPTDMQAQFMVLASRARGQ